MKNWKRIWLSLTMGTVILAILWMVVIPVIADDGDNFKEAGLQVLEQKERILIDKKIAIEVNLQEIAQDQVITAKEMFALHDAIGDFNQAKQDADKYLDFYGLETSVVLDEKLVKLVKDKYYEIHTLRKRDVGGEVRTFFTKLTGKDVRVEGGMQVRGAEWFLIVVNALLLVLAVLSLIAFICKKEKAVEVCAISTILFIAFMIILFLW